jgi:hypothetical protein
MDKGRSSGDDDATAAAAAAAVGDDNDDQDGTDDGAAEGSGDGSETCLFGRWQVQRHVPVPLVDGQVPVNAHGNFELWSR